MLNRALVIHRADTAIHTVVDLRRVAMAASEVFDDGTLFESGRLHLVLPRAPAMVNGDLLSLEEAAKNLISNALQHGKGTVTVSVTLADGVAKLSVHDEGSGVSDAEAQRFGERFRRGNDHRTHGTGIGLSIAHAVASAHQTAIKMTADGDGFEIGFGLPTAAVGGR
jgi:two-component system sensor histidine kinase TctE